MNKSLSLKDFLRRVLLECPKFQRKIRGVMKKRKADRGVPLDDLSRTERIRKIFLTVGLVLL